ncbi:hypothetical protein PFICI_15281 [Pestalotiopsis fici W106-1]|uniref:Uncharacterized protein n=1 Tax=Pestalotiopsis fici (strain W106-1 / CGMCC3.15140) TaxID=1229662 RepID=W3WJX3_PESFW|nr:uncharacterized protein PFICI_15281 [Pestalotiopsis fici W106-1]ETS73106.1 hypothetical protein PFICI_15281 [Pestalotiopsis fici W106-1]
METSAPKRRKTSSLPPGGSDSPAAPSSGAQSVRRSTRRQTSLSISPDGEGRARTLRTGPAPRESPSDGSDGSDGGDDQAVTAQLEGASENRPASDPAGSNMALGPSVREPQSPIRQSLGGMRGRPRRSMHRPSPRPLPPPSVQEEELLDPFKGRALRRSPPRGVLPVQEPDEPELPPTPTEKGLSNPDAVNTSPMGIHNTPSKRPRRSRALADKLRSGSSPLKQPPVRPTDFESFGKEALAKNSAKVLRPASKSLAQHEAALSQALQPAARIETSDQGKERNAQEQSQSTPSKPHTARRIKDPDPLAEKTATRDLLQAEVSQLLADLEVARRENDNLNSPQHRGSAGRTSTTIQDPDALFDILLRHAPPLEQEPQVQASEAWLKAALDPMSFLPFGSQLAALPSPFQPLDQVDQLPPTSHEPLQMSLAEERPYLELFTPLSFASATTIIPREPSDDAPDVIQQHHISITSMPKGLFSAQIDMLVDTKTLSILELVVPKLEPAAVGELGPFIERVLGTDTNSLGSSRRNIAVMTWAMAEWTRLASKRARLWSCIAKELGHTQGILKCARDLRRAKRRKRLHKTVVDVTRANSDEEVEIDGNKFEMTRKQLVSELGRTGLDLVLGSQGKDKVELRINWQITFDWTGEGRNTIKLLVHTPGKWHSKDTAGRLAKIPVIFDKLVQDGDDPMGALKTVVALLARDEKE